MTDYRRFRATALGFALVGAFATLSGCASEQTASKCPIPDGTACMSTEDVYAATNANDHIPKPAKTSGKAGTADHTTVAPTKIVDGATGPAKSAPRVSVQVDTHAAGVVISSAPNLVPTAYVAHSDTSPSAAATRVYRAPAKILAIYVAPWQDDQGDLHLSQRVMTEVIGRRWKVPGYSNIATVSPDSDDNGLAPPSALQSPVSQVGAAAATSVATRSQ
jgi:conjugal transfer pilus assembly protein TraV